MKKELIKAVNLMSAFKNGIMGIFKKKEVTHMDNLAPIMALLQEYDFKEMSVSQMIALKNAIDSDFDKLLENIKATSEDNIEYIHIYKAK